MARSRKATDLVRNNEAYLEIIRGYIADAKSPLASCASWLHSDFWESKWTGSFTGDDYFEIDWSVQLNNGVYLSDKTPASWQFRTWICAQTHPSLTGLPSLRPNVAYHRVLETARLVDYFILHHDADELVEHGFGAVSEGDLLQIVTDLASAKTEVSIYRWPEYLYAFITTLDEQSISNREIEYYKNKHPEISVVATSPEDRLLPFPDDESVVRARIALLKNNLYRYTSPAGIPYYNPDYAAIISNVYRDTLRGRSSKSIAPELAWGSNSGWQREMSSVFVKEGQENIRLARRTVAAYCRRLKSLSVLDHPDGSITAPSPSVLSILDSRTITHSLRTSPAGRFKTVPSAHVFYALRQAITFFLEHGDHLLDSYVRLAKAMSAHQLKPSVFELRHDISDYLLPRTVSAGIRTFSISRAYTRLDLAHESPTFEKKRKIFTSLRNHAGLADGVRVLYGGIATTLGALAARRRSEFLRLHPANFLDATGTCLVLDAAKTGVGTYREQIVCPVPPIVVRMLNRLKRFQEDMMETGLLAEYTNLLACPGRGEFGLLDIECIESVMDCFFDYIEMPDDGNGRRFYLRFHQLRRFFPQTFMESGLPGGREILSEFLGHTNSEEIWTYITEVCPGDAIEQSAAQTATSQLRDGNSAFEDLAQFVRDTFGIHDFWAVSEEELNGYILTLEQIGAAKVSIEYIDTPDGIRHKMLMKVRESYNGQTIKQNV
ncbi:hypothetical protein LGM58_41840 [Burkholderia contaminans]|uniref:hypothetical protein n=1 Tax=Burkholderia contaminans TaxID=488447 RepID=UPI001CF34DE6|nr:hypothetical protein [Burkholderia contaminans]MCA7889723.1 hypothetical protein [Burkholderia contaminans]